jgi:hypothetical protein
MKTSLQWALGRTVAIFAVAAIIKPFASETNH